MQPIEIYQRSATQLEIAWQRGGISRINASMLRRACPCSECAQRQGMHSASYIPVMSQLSLRIRAVDLVGSSAIHVIWEDGHDRSIYPYSLLCRIFPPEMGTAEAELP